MLVQSALATWDTQSKSCCASMMGDLGVPPTCVCCQGAERGDKEDAADGHRSLNRQLRALAGGRRLRRTHCSPPERVCTVRLAMLCMLCGACPAGIHMGGR